MIKSAITGTLRDANITGIREFIGYYFEANMDHLVIYELI